MESVLQNRFDLSRKGVVSAYIHRKNKVNLVRYADDFVVTAATEEIAIEAKAIISDFLKTRGLELSEEKTLITHIDDGFDMLGWTFRKFKSKLITKPSKKSIHALVASLSDTILRRGKAWNQDILIEKLNQKIRGWANYHQTVCAKDAFAHIDYILFEFLWQWAKRRHPKKGKRWIKERYWHKMGDRNWVFKTDKATLICVAPV
jgi:RNA-directed DNA polymerase